MIVVGIIWESVRFVVVWVVVTVAILIKYRGFTVPRGVILRT